MMKKLLIILLFAFGGLIACEPNTDTKEGQEAVKQDTIDPREGEREGEVGEGEIGGYEHNQ